MVKFCTGIAHHNVIPHVEQNSEICIEVIDNDVIPINLSVFVEKHSTLKYRISVVCG